MLKEKFRAIEAMSHELSRLAGEGAWEAFGELQRRRMELLEEAFASPIPPGEAEEVAAFIQSILAMDGATAALLERERHHLGERIEALRLGKKAHRAYARHG